MLLFLPLAATLLGSLLGLKADLGPRGRLGAMLGFAAGVMLAASVWSLLIPAFDMTAGGAVGVMQILFGFALGCALMLALDKLMPHQHIDEDAPEGRPSHMSRPMLLVMAVMLHNIPEGLATGVLLAAAWQGGEASAGALAFGVGMAIQNLPEGLAVIMPMRAAGMSARKCRTWGVLSSLAEPAAALVGWVGVSALSGSGGAVMPIMLSMAAGAMIFIVVEELIPESQSANDGHSSTYGFLVGFLAMAALAMGLG